MKRALVTALAVLVACSLLAVGAFATTAGAQEESPTEIDSCTVIDEPGEYEFVADVETDQPGSCIEIRADNVSIDGNGHVLSGPGTVANGTGVDLQSDGDSRDLEVRNLEISGWEHGIYAGGDYELADSVVRNNDNGLYHRQGGADNLTNVTIEGNDLGINSMMGGATGTDVTIRENQVGILGIDGGNYHLESSRIVDNEAYGAEIEHSSRLNLTDSTVSGNGDHGLFFPHYGFPVWGHIENTTVSDNGGDGIRASSDVHSPIRLVDVTVENNDGLEVNAAPDEEFSSSVTASDLHVGQSATTAFEAEPIRLEPVDSDELPAHDAGTAVGDGLNVSGNVTGPVDLELDVDTDDDTVDLWRHDGTEWETVEEELPVTNGTVEASVDRNGTYVPGTEADDSDETGDDSDGSDDGDDSDGSDGTGDDPADDSDDSDDSRDDSEDGTDSSDGDDQTPTQTPSDKDGQKDTPTPTPSDSDGEKKKKTDTPTDSIDSSDCGCPPSDDDDTGEENESTPADETTASPEDHQQADERDGTDAQAEVADDGGSLGDGPGFGPAVALAALLGSALLMRRRG